MINQYLDPKEAIRLMLDGEVLKDSFDNDAYFIKDRFYIRRSLTSASEISYFHKLRRKPQKKKRLMTQWECLLWATSDNANGWIVLVDEPWDRDKWRCPQYFTYSEDLTKNLKRAKLLPDGSGIDESTITDFMIEVEE